MPRSRRQRADTDHAADSLRTKLDQLAERAIDRVLGKGDDATLREITETLKAVDAYHARVRGSGDKPPESAWANYTRAIEGNRADGARH